LSPNIRGSSTAPTGWFLVQKIGGKNLKGLDKRAGEKIVGVGGEVGEWQDVEGGG